MSMSQARANVFGRATPPRIVADVAHAPKSPMRGGGTNTPRAVGRRIRAADRCRAAAPQAVAAGFSPTHSSLRFGLVPRARAMQRAAHSLEGGGGAGLHWGMVWVERRPPPRWRPRCLAPLRRCSRAPAAPERDGDDSAATTTARRWGTTLLPSPQRLEPAQQPHRVGRGNVYSFFGELFGEYDDDKMKRWLAGAEARIDACCARRAAHEYSLPLHAMRLAGLERARSSTWSGSAHLRSTAPGLTPRTWSPWTPCAKLWPASVCINSGPRRRTEQRQAVHHRLQRRAGHRRAPGEQGARSVAPPRWLVGGAYGPHARRRPHPSLHRGGQRPPTGARRGVATSGPSRRSSSQAGIRLPRHEKGRSRCSGNESSGFELPNTQVVNEWNSAAVAALDVRKDAILAEIPAAGFAGAPVWVGRRPRRSQRPPLAACRGSARAPLHHVARSRGAKMDFIRRVHRGHGAVALQ